MTRQIERHYTDEELQVHAIATLVSEEEEVLLLLEDEETATEWSMQAMLDYPYDIGEVKIGKTISWMED